MSKIALIDGDMVCYRCAASAEGEPLDISLERADALIERILYETGSSCSEIWLTGSGNFRYDIYPEYKANRSGKPKPRWLSDTMSHLITGWGARVSDGNEADDELGISQATSEGNTVICTNDKDLLQVPGEHFNPVTGVRHTISPLDGLHNFYFQIIMGDTSDNIKGYDGIARAKVPKFLEDRVSYLMALENEYDMYDFTSDLYADHKREEHYLTTAQCLYIQRKPGDMWHVPNDKPHDLNQD